LEPIKLFVVEDERSCFVYDEQTLAVAGIETEEAAKAAFGENGSWRRLWLKKPLGKHAREIAALCRVTDPVTGFRMDDTKEAGARCQVLVERWEGFEGNPSFEAFENLPLPLADVVDALIRAHMYPNILANPDFLNAWKGKLQASETERPAG